MNKKNILLLGLLILLGLAIFIRYSYAIDEGNIDFYDDNLKNALIASGVDVDNDNEISYYEASLVTNLTLYNKNIHNLAGLTFFENLEYLDIRYNYIDTLASFVALPKLEVLSVAGNMINYTPLRNLDESIRTDIDTLLGRNVVLEGLYDQIIDYDAEMVADKPVFKVLFVYVNDISADVVNHGEPLHYSHLLTEEEINWFDLQRDFFEKSVEKMTNYAVNIVTDIYVTNNQITEYGNAVTDEYWITADTIEEIDDIRENYDSIFVCAIYDSTIVPHTAGGLGSMAQAMVYFDNFSTEDVFKLESGRVGDNIPSMIHEFIHSVEDYGLYTDLNIWEWHLAQRYYTANNPINDSQNIMAEHRYLIGSVNPNNDEETGIIDEIWKLPISKIYNKDIAVSMDSVSLNSGETIKIYAAARKMNATSADNVLWSFNNIQWSSDNDNIASVSNDGVITANAAGKSIITVTGSDEQTTTIEVEVIGDISNTLMGDVNDDGVVNRTDAILVAKYIIDRPNLSNVNFDISRADMNNDGLIKMNDVIAILKNYLNIE